MMWGVFLLKIALLWFSFLSLASKWCFCSAFVGSPMIAPSKPHQSALANLDKHDWRRRSRRSGNRIIVATSSSCNNNHNNNNNGTTNRQGQGQQQQHDLHSTSNLSLLQESIGKMTHFFASMVDVKDYRFYYRCLPPSGETIHKVHPIRDLAAAWDATKILDYFWNQHDNHHHFLVDTSDDGHPKQDLAVLPKAVHQTLQYYHQLPLFLEGSHYDGAMILNPQILQETSNIAHSALFLLAYTGATRHCRDIILPFSNNACDDIPKVNINGLTRALLSMQQVNGAFHTEFGDNNNDIYRGIDFFPGEAMLALMEIYHHEHLHVLDPTTRNAILPSMERALDFYANYYHEKNPDTNYNIWQIQAFARFVHHAVSAKEDTIVNNNSSSSNNNNDRTTSLQKAADYVLQMCKDIISSKSWKYQLARGRPFYPNLSTVEIACGLDALVDGIQVAETIMATSGSPHSDAAFHHQHDSLLGLFWKNADNAVDFLQWSLDQAPTEPTAMGYGGLGYGGTQILEQRLDVSGHTVSAFLKIHRLLLARSHDSRTSINNT